MEADFRLNAGFGTYDNIALLIEMGYQIYTKAHNHHLVNALKKRITSETHWERGANAEMVTWQNMPLKRSLPSAFLLTDARRDKPYSEYATYLQDWDDFGSNIAGHSGLHVLL